MSPSSLLVLISAAFQVHLALGVGGSPHTPPGHVRDPLADDREDFVASLVEEPGDVVVLPLAILLGLVRGAPN